jgi:hypothetical protein
MFAQASSMGFHHFNSGPIHFPAGPLCAPIRAPFKVFAFAGPVKLLQFPVWQGEK